MTDEPSKVPTWALLAFALIGFLALLFVIQDPMNSIADESQPTYATLVSGVLTAIVGPGILKRM